MDNKDAVKALVRAGLIKYGYFASDICVDDIADQVVTLYKTVNGENSWGEVYDSFGDDSWMESDYSRHNRSSWE